jgi:hypothetical protein
MRMNEDFLLALDSVGKAFIAAWEAIKDEFNRIINEMKDIETQTKNNREFIQNHNWYVPKNTFKNHQVLDRKPVMARIRNQI